MSILSLVQPEEPRRVEGEEREHQNVINCGEYLGTQLHYLQYFYKFGHPHPHPPKKLKPAFLKLCFWD